MFSPRTATRAGGFTAFALAGLLGASAIWLVPAAARLGGGYAPAGCGAAYRLWGCGGYAPG
ncbi:hypothetical protein [Streptomyces sp. NPDC059909]|uniref:hypothetical protein n=1 Tax=Streptomyces sp. NPDC059909 TaxID=3346998 RepID=UPI00365662FA